MSGLVYLAEPIDQADPSNAIGWQLRQAVEAVVDTAGCTVFRPKDAYIVSEKPTWQQIDAINERALAQASAVVAVLPPGVAALGVPAEIEQALGMGLPVFILTSFDVADFSVQVRAWERRGATLWVREAGGQVEVTQWAHQLAQSLERGSANAYRIQRTGPGGVIPSRGYPDDAGLDLTVTTSIMLASGGAAWLPTEIAGALPAGTFGLILGRSSTWFKHRILVPPSVIDAGWRGDLMVAVYNLGRAAVCIEAGERIAQVVVLPAWRGAVREVDTLPDHQRGLNGFGSTSKDKERPAVG